MYFDTRSVVSDIHLPEKNNLTTPRPITDLGIRRALKKDDTLKNVKIPPKDEKILGLIAKKGEFEKKYWKQRLNNSMAWDDEKDTNDRLKLEKYKTHKMNVEILREEDRQMVQVKKLERQKKRLKKKAELLTELEKANKATAKALKKQRKIKAKAIQDMAAKETLHKQQQEKNWWDVNSKMYQKRMQEKIDHDKKRSKADEERENRLIEEMQKVAKENEEERLQFTERYVIYEKKFKDGQKTLTSKIERRLANAEANHEKKIHEKIEEINEDAKKEEERLHHAMKEKKKQEKKEHKKMLKMFKQTQQSIERANQNISKAFELASEHIKAEREEKEKQQRKHMKKLKKADEKRKKQVAKEIKKEEEIMIEKQAERMKTLEKTRHVANDTRLLRSRLMDTFGSEDFDKKLFRVERFRSLGTRPSTQSWNTSSISLL